jgi:arylsulfatase A-like enzyme
MRIIALLALLPAPSIAEGLAAQDAAPKRPNVLFIAVDDLNAWTGALQGHPQAKTPNLDRLAARGVLFTRAYCTAPACNPSRASLLTGVRPSSSGVYHNDQPWKEPLKDAVTLPRHFKDHGYRVVGGGKIFHGGFDDRASWDDYAKLPGPNPHPEKVPANGIPKTAHFDWGPVAVDDAQMPDHRLAGWAAEVLSKRSEQPLFLAVGFVKPHLPWFVPKKWFEMFPEESIVLPDVDPDDLNDVPTPGRKMARPEGDHAKVLAAGQWKAAVRGYLAAIAFMDAQLGRVLDALDAGPYAKDTIVMLWGDHGWHLGEKQHWRKFALWEEATRAPLLVAAPGTTPSGSRCDRPVDFLGIYPTLVELCGLPAPKTLEGSSFAPLLRDPGAAWERPALTTHGKGNHALRTERWRYIRYADGAEELYDHAADPRERVNLSSRPEHAALKAELAAGLPAADAPDAPRSERKGE